jgi:hypothetical protein
VKTALELEVVESKIQRAVARTFEKYLYLMPLVMVCATLLSNFVEFNYIVVGNILGYSLLTNLIGYTYFNRHRSKHCFFSRNVWIGLVAINVVDIIGNHIPYFEYSSLFTTVVCSVCLLFYVVDKLRWL